MIGLKDEQESLTEISSVVIIITTQKVTRSDRHCLYDFAVQGIVVGSLKSRTALKCTQLWDGN